MFKKWIALSNQEVYILIQWTLTYIFIYLFISVYTYIYIILFIYYTVYTSSCLTSRNFQSGSVIHWTAPYASTF